MGIKDDFQKFTRAGYFSRIDTEHPLELHIGLDDSGDESIELRHNCPPHKIRSTGVIEINQYKKEKYNTIRFSLKDEESKTLFYMFCEDIIENTRSIQNPSEGYSAIINRYHLWRKMFHGKNSNLLTEIEIMGLIGELLFLSGPLKDRIGIQSALQSWSGQELTHKDFSFGNSWAEIKTISRGKSSVRISSLEQLESANDGELVVYSLEKMSENYVGITLNGLVKQIKSMFGVLSDEEKFFSQLAINGYTMNDYYDNYVYELSGVKHYAVTSDFPRITKDNIPDAVVKLSYELSLVELSEFEIES